MVLVERQAQLEVLARSLQQAGTGAGRTIFVSGEAGAGKSALVEHFAEQAPRGTRVLWGHCDALQTSRVLGPVTEVLAGLSPLGTPHAASFSREQLFFALFERLSPPNPPALVILEDLHWADEATLDLVRFLGRRIQRTRCLLLATYRDDELAPTHPLRGVLGDLTGTHAARMQIPNLSLSAIEQLSRGTPHTPSHIYRVTAGNAFFVRELLSAPQDTVPETVCDVVLARLMPCAATTRALVELVSLVPGAATSWLSSNLLGDIGAAADEAVARRLLRYQGDALAFRHELGRLAVASTIPRGRARELHARILRVLVEHDADLSQLVHHAAHAGDARALIEFAPRAAEQASLAGAHREAVAHLTTLLRHADALRLPERARFQELHATACNLTNEVSAALKSGAEALALWQELGDVRGQARVQLLLAQQYWKAGEKQSTNQYVAAAVALLETLPPGPELAMAYSNRSRFAMTGNQTAEAVDYGQRALKLGEQFADHRVQTHALNNIGSALLNDGDNAGLAALERSLAVSLEHNLQEHAGRAYANLVETAVCQRRQDLTGRFVPEALAYCELHEVLDCLSYVRAYVAQSEVNNGRWNNALQLATELVEHHTLAAAQRIPSLVALALVRARRGESDVDPLLDEALELALPTGELDRIGPVTVARAEVAWYRGDVVRVAREATLGLSAATRGNRWFRGALAYWAWLADPAVAPSPDIAEPYRLMIAGDWRSAAALWGQLDSPYEQALALAAGPEEALRQSLTILERLGAAPLSAVVRHRLRRLGARRVPRGPRVSTRVNPRGLTAREVQVVRLLAEGHTNTELARRLHLAPKTVDHHVSAILTKLETRTRTEAVAAAFGLGILAA